MLVLCFFCVAISCLSKQKNSLLRDVMLNSDWQYYACTLHITAVWSMKYCMCISVGSMYVCTAPCTI